MKVLKRRVIKTLFPQNETTFPRRVHPIFMQRTIEISFMYIENAFVYEWFVLIALFVTASHTKIYIG